MAICKKCKQEYTSLKEAEEFCPACKVKEHEIRPSSVQDKHLQIKQKRFTSE